VPITVEILPEVQRMVDEADERKEIGAMHGGDDPAPAPEVVPAGPTRRSP
jgi:hypothetical protein